MVVNPRDGLNPWPSKKRKIEIELPRETELDLLFIATLEAGKDEKKKTLSLFGHVRAETDPIKVTVHGTCTNAGKFSAAAGAGIYWGPNAKRNRAIRAWGTQNNARSDLTAVISALQLAPAEQSLEISTRSEYAIRSAKYHAFQNDARGWRCPNGDLLKILSALIKERVAPVHFMHLKKEIKNVNGHLTEAKRLAKQGS
ncbi:hypothetical protein DFH07DRAFT_731163, partial [Mycena maculata]